MKNKKSGNSESQLLKRVVCVVGVAALLLGPQASWALNLGLDAESNIEVDTGIGGVPGVPVEFGGQAEQRNQTSFAGQAHQENAWPFERSSARGAVEAGSEASEDRDIQARVLAALRSESSIDASRIQVGVRRGTVWLGGRVRTHAEKSIAIRIASSVVGVVGVVDNIAISVDVKAGVGLRQT